MTKSARGKQRKNIRVVVRQPPNKPKKKKSVKKSEVTMLGKALRSLGGIAGGAAGSFLGQPALGRSVGSNLGASLSKWIGSGDYAVKSNTLTRASAVESIPMMHRNSQSVIVRHREFLGDVVGSTTFTVRKVVKINPGLESSFPWLATIAQNFQEYTVLGLVFHYVPTAGDAVSSTNNALGSVVMSTNYRATAAAPTNKLEQLNEYFSNDARPSEAFCHPIECDPRENPYNVQYIRSGAVPAGEDPKTYDLGTMYLTTSGMQASVTVGELWCTYEVELRKPVAVGLTGVAVPSVFATATPAQSSGTNLAAALTTGISTDTIGVILSGSTSIFTIQFPAGTAGTYLISLTGTNGVTNSTWNAPSLVNATFAHTVGTQILNSSGVVGYPFVYTVAVTITDPSIIASVLMSQSSWVSISSNCLNITQCAP